MFNIKEEMKSKIEKEYQEEVNQMINSSLCFGLNFINTFDLQKIFPLEKIFKVISDNYFLISYRIYSLLARTYIKKDEKKKYLILDKLFEFIDENKNLIDFELVYNLVNNDFKDDQKRDDFIKKFVKGIKIYFDHTIRDSNIFNAIYYCKLVFENSHIFTKKDKDKAADYICNKYFNNIKAKEWNGKILKKLDLFEYEDLKNHLSLENLEEFYYQLPITSIELFMRILKFMPREVYKLLKDISKEILNTILDYYNNEEKYTYGPENIEERKIWWPNIETIDEMQKYIELEAIIIPPTSQMTDIFKGRCIYITFSKKWGDPDFDEDGIGVQIINEKVTKIGYRDIAF